MADFAEIRVERSGAHILRVVHVAKDGVKTDLGAMAVCAVSAHIVPHDLPHVDVTFYARIVEVEVEDG